MLLQVDTAIKNYLVANNIGVMGRTMFIDDIPSRLKDENDTAVMFRNTGSLESDQYLPIRRPTVQIVVQSKDPAIAKAKIEEIFDLFHQLPAGTQIDPAIDLMKVNSIQEPTFIFVDDEGRHQHSFNIVLHIRDN